MKSEIQLDLKGACIFLSWLTTAMYNCVCPAQYTVCTNVIILNASTKNLQNISLRILPITRSVLASKAATDVGLSVRSAFQGSKVGKLGSPITLKLSNVYVYKKILWPFFYLSLLETPNIICQYMDCVFLMHIVK